MKKYFFSYSSFNVLGNWGFGNCVLTVEEIKTKQDLLNAEEAIVLLLINRGPRVIARIVIMNWILLQD